ncbi:hypothetical protein BH10ACI3_BH10ACI3_04920 [soil metagenome]
MEQLFGAIPTVLNGLEPNAEIDEAVVFAAWARCAGELLNARTAPLQYLDNRLVIAVEDNTWKRHLEELSPQMLAKINGSVGHGRVRFIEFQIDAASIDAVRKSVETMSPLNSSADLEPSLKTAAYAISDEALREQFLDAAACYLAKQK